MGSLVPARKIVDTALADACQFLVSQLSHCPPAGSQEPAYWPDRKQKVNKTEVKVDFFSQFSYGNSSVVLSISVDTGSNMFD